MHVVAGAKSIRTAKEKVRQCSELSVTNPIRSKRKKVFSLKKIEFVLHYRRLEIIAKYKGRHWRTYLYSRRIFSETKKPCEAYFKQLEAHNQLVDMCCHRTLF